MFVSLLVSVSLPVFVSEEKPPPVEVVGESVVLLQDVRLIAANKTKKFLFEKFKALLNFLIEKNIIITNIQYKNLLEYIEYK